MNIELIYFDCGGVLIKNPLAEIFRVCGAILSVPREWIEEAYFVYEKDFATGKISESQFWKKFALNRNLPALTDTNLWKKALIDAYVELPFTLGLIRNLKNKGWRIGILSNIEEPTLRYFEERYSEIFKPQIYSCKQGFMKPEVEIYRRAIEASGVHPENILFIDDKAENIDVAREVGMTGIVFENARQLVQKLKVMNIIDEEVNENSILL